MTPDERLTELTIARDSLEAALASGRSHIEIEIRGRRTRMEATTRVLEYYNDQIDKLERKIAASTRSARNSARIVR